MTVILNPKLFNLLLAQGLVVWESSGIYTKQDGKKYKVKVVSANELESA